MKAVMRLRLSEVAIPQELTYVSFALRLYKNMWAYDCTKVVGTIWSETRYASPELYNAGSSQDK
jgi:hypothetical protein